MSARTNLSANPKHTPNAEAQHRDSNTTDRQPITKSNTDHNSRGYVTDCPTIDLNMSDIDVRSKCLELVKQLSERHGIPYIALRHEYQAWEQRVQNANIPIYSYMSTVDEFGYPEIEFRKPEEIVEEFKKDINFQGVLEDLDY